MKKLMDEHRKRFGEFEVIEWVDEDKVRSLRDRIDVDVPVSEDDDDADDGCVVAAVVVKLS